MKIFRFHYYIATNSAYKLNLFNNTPISSGHRTISLFWKILKVNVIFLDVFQKMSKLLSSFIVCQSLVINIEILKCCLALTLFTALSLFVKLCLLFLELISLTVLQDSAHLCLVIVE